jgi:hypothetical protein
MMNELISLVEVNVIIVERANEEVMRHLRAVILEIKRVVDEWSNSFH